MLPPFAYLCFMLAASPISIAVELSHPVFEKRRAAMAALDAIGEPALPALRKVLTQTDDPEAAERAAQLLQTISTRADNSRRISPTLVELNAVNVKAVAVYAELEKQTGYQFTTLERIVAMAREKIVTVRTTGKVPYWQAVELVNVAAGLDVSNEQLLIRTRDSSYRRRDSSYETPPQVNPNLVPLVPTTGIPKYTTYVNLIERTKDSLKSRDANSAVRVQLGTFPPEILSAYEPGTMPIVLNVAAEPKLSWIRTTHIRVTHAVCGNGEIVLPDKVETIGDWTGIPSRGGLNRSVTRGDWTIQQNTGNVMFVRKVEGEPQQMVTFPPSQKLLNLMSPRRPISHLKSLTGVLVGNALSEPELLAAIPELSKQLTTAQGANGITLRGSVTAPDADGNSVVDITLIYSPLRVTAFSSHGITIADSLGRPNDVSVNSSTRSLIINGERVTHIQMQATGPREMFHSVSFRGSCQKDVLVPFTLTDIAVAPGTNTIPTIKE